MHLGDTILPPAETFETQSISPRCRRSTPVHSLNFSLTSTEPHGRALGAKWFRCLFMHAPQQTGNWSVENKPLVYCNWVEIVFVNMELNFV